MTSGAIPAGEVARKRVRPLDQGSSSAEPPGLGLDCQESLVRYLARSDYRALAPIPERLPNVCVYPRSVPEDRRPEVGCLFLAGRR